MRRSQLRGSTRRSVDKTRGRRQARRAVTIRLREDRGKGVGIFWRRCGLALCDHLRHSILVAPVIVNFTARVRIDLCDESLDPSLLSQELLIVAIFLLGWGNSREGATLHCISGSHATLLSDRGERRKPVGRESSREPGSGLVGSGSRCGAQ